MSQTTTPSPICTAAALTERDKALIEFIINQHLTHVPFELAVQEAMAALNDMTELERCRVEDDLLHALRAPRDGPGEYDPWKDML
jgi:hypothetical protein